MKKLVCTEPHVAVLKDYEDRVINPDEVRVKVNFASPKHGTEMADFAGKTPFIDGKFDPEWQVFMERGKDEPRGVIYGDMPLGNMFVGHIIECGKDVTQFKVGDRVCSYGPIKETEIVKAVNNYKLRKMKETDSALNAVCYDPAQFALGAIRDGNVRPGDNVAVFGLGAIGLIGVQIASKLGARVIAFDPIERRRDVALKLGAIAAFDSTNVDAGMKIKELTDKRGADVIFESSGSMYALQAAFKGLAYGGTISYGAFAKPFPAGLWLGEEAHFNNAKVVFTRACSEPNPDYPRWNRHRIEDVCWDMLMSGYLDCSDIIYPIVNFNSSAEAFCHYVDKCPAESIKLGVTFEKEN